MDNQDYPKQFYEGSSNNSAGFVTPYKLGSGVMRGTQIIANTDGSKVILGLLPKNQGFGIAFTDTTGNIISTVTSNTYSFYDTSGNLVSQITGPTQYIYDLTTNKNILQMGKLPDGTFGLAIAKSGFNVSDAFS